MSSKQNVQNISPAVLHQHTETDTHPLTVIVPLHPLTCLADHSDPLGLPASVDVSPRAFPRSLPKLRQHVLCCWYALLHCGMKWNMSRGVFFVFFYGCYGKILHLSVCLVIPILNQTRIYIAYPHLKDTNTLCYSISRISMQQYSKDAWMLEKGMVC